MLIIYLIEIRNRALLLVIGSSLCFCTVYFYSDILLSSILLSSGQSHEGGYVCLCASELLNSYISISVYLTGNYAFYQMFYHVLSFLKNALYFEEFRFARRLFYQSLLTYFLSNVIFYEFFFKILVLFFLGFARPEQGLDEYAVKVFFEFRLEESVYFYVKNHFMFILFSQFFLIVLSVLTLNYRVLKIFKKYVYLVFLLISTFLVPPDMLFQSLVFLLFVFLFELHLIFFFFRIRFNLVKNSNW